MNSDVAIRFLSQFFARAQGDVYISSLPNERGQQPPERHIITRDSDKVARFCEKWNQIGRGLFFCIATLRPGAQPTERGSLRCKANVAELPTIHVDIDFDKVIADPDNPQAFVISRLESLKIPPSITVASGGGVHAYWLLDKPIDDMERAERLMKAMMVLVAGDPAVCEVAHLMRLPGSTNSKREEARPAALLKLSDGNIGLDELEDMAKGEPVIEWVDKEKTVVPATPAARFEALSSRVGIKPPVDVEERLAAMRHQGAGENGVHVTQLSVTASLLNGGYTIESVVDRVLNATMAIAPPDWNREDERSGIEGMCRSWQAKRLSDATSDPASNVVHLNPRSKPKPAAKKYTGNEIGAIIGQAVLDRLQDRGMRLVLTGGGMHLYDPLPTVWRPCGDEDKQGFDVALHKAMSEFGQFLPKAMDVGARWLRSHPDLFEPGISWDTSDWLPVRNGMLDLRTRELRPHAPEDYITRRLDVDYDPTATADLFLNFLDRTFSTYSSEPTLRPDGTRLSERTEIVTAYLEFLGASIKVRGLARAQRCGLWLHGASNSGKSELGAIVRGLVGGSIASPSVKNLNGDFGLKHVHNKSALITDEASQSTDVINENCFKVLVTGEPVDVAVKKGEAITGYQFHIPVILIGNSLPKVSDETQALFNRSIVIRCARVFSPEEVVELHRQLGVVGPSVGSWLVRECGSGILNLALDARDRLVRRGRYEITPLIALAREEFRQDTSPVHGFLAVATERRSTSEETRTDILSAFHGYEIEQGVKKRYLTSAKLFWSRLKNAAPYCNTDARKSGKERYINGLSLTDEGMRLKFLSDTEDT